MKRHMRTCSSCEDNNDVKNNESDNENNAEMENDNLLNNFNNNNNSLESISTINSSHFYEDAANDIVMEEINNMTANGASTEHEGICLDLIDDTDQS